MRLRLAVHRHDLPSAHILWSTDGLRPNDENSGANTTVAQFLQQLNEVVPIESEDWGLEDYVVEVQGFECVHYSVLNQILKEDDEVTIRPLQHSDRRFLRVSGRHQVSSDGRHLIDGVAFGRPLLKRPDRPPVRIPSIKRPRLLENYNDLDEANGTNQLVLRENVELELENGIADDEYEDPLDDTLSGTVKQAIASQGSLRLADGTRQSQRLNNPRKRRRAGLGLGIEAETPHGETQLDASNLSVPRAGVNGSGSPCRISSRSSVKSVRFDGHEIETPVTVLLPEESDEDEDDEDFDPEDQSSESSESNKENIEPHPQAKDGVQKSRSKSNKEQNSTNHDEQLSLSAALEPDISDSDSDSDSDAETGISLSSSKSDSSLSSSSLSSSLSSTSTSDSSSDSSSESSDPASSEDESASASPPIKEKPPAALSVGTSISRPQSAPGKGLSRTQRRNQRRKLKLKASKLAQTATTPASLPKSSVILEPNRELNLEGDTVLNPQEQGDDGLLEAKKALLLDALGSNQEKNALEESSGNTLPSAEQTELAILDAKNGRDEAVPQKHAPDENQPRRSRLDTASTRRLIFGSLGLRTPKTKKDEDDLRAKLSANIKAPSEELQREDTNKDNDLPTDNTESWQAKVALAAVECYDEDVELSTPPFPFVQRWDPQQQTKSKKNRGSKASKRQKRKDSQYYQDEDDYDYRADESHVPVGDPNSTLISFSYDDALENAHNALDEDSYKVAWSGSPRSTSSSIQAAVNEQILQDTNLYSARASQEPDLPELPADLSECKALSLSLAKPNAIVAFKQLEMSARTKWCPVTSDYRTATIEKVLENGDLQLTLAARDVARKLKHYDPITGARIYDRFECPSDEDDAGENDERYLEISILDMVEPKIVQVAEDVALENPDQNVPVEESTDVAMATEPNIEASLVTDAEGAEKGFGDVLETPTTIQVHNQRGKGQHLVDQLPKEVSESTRKEYSLLMREAGFRSEVADDVKQAFEPAVWQAGSQKASPSSQNGASGSGPLVEGIEETDGSQLITIPESGQHGHDSSFGPSTQIKNEQVEEQSMKTFSPEQEPVTQSPSFAVPDTAGVGENSDDEMPHFDSFASENSADPDLFPMLSEEINGDGAIPSSTARPETPIGKESQGNAPQSSSSLPSPSFFKSQPLPKSSRVSKEDEAWDAEYLPTESSALAAEQKRRKPMTRSSSGNSTAPPPAKGNAHTKLKKSSKRHNLFDLPVSSDLESEPELEQTHSLSLDGALDEPSCSPPIGDVDESHLEDPPAPEATSSKEKNLFVPRSIQSKITRKSQKRGFSPISNFMSSAPPATTTNHIDLLGVSDGDQTSGSTPLPQGSGWIKKSESPKNGSTKKTKKKKAGKVRTRSIV